MVKNNLGIFILCIAFSAKSQTNFQLNYNSTFSGRNILFSSSKDINTKHEIGAGLRINLHNINGKLAHPDDQFNTYKKRLFMTQPINYFGISGFVNRQIFSNSKTIKPYIFYDLQATYSGTRNRFFLPYDVALDGTILYKEHIQFWGPFTWVEQNIGFGFKANLFDNLYLNQRMGFGSAFILGYEKQLLDKYFNWFAWNFSTLFTIGLEYRLGSKTE
jgi:hypothetical protein